MKNTRILLTFCFLLFWTMSYGQNKFDKSNDVIAKEQSNRGGGLGQFTKFKEKSDDKDTKPQWIQIKQEELNEVVETDSEESNDSVYFARIVKKNGWFTGVGDSLSLDHAQHLSCYYKLSKKNKAGNWTFVEAFDGYGNPTTSHQIVSYLVNQFDDSDRGANEDWKDKMLTVCKWEFIGDASGQEVIQERALNAEKQVVYVYNPVKVGQHEYTGSYVDSWGMPIFMRTDSLGNDSGYANFIKITRDSRGFEVKFEFVDRYGIPQKNKDGAYMTLKEYDDFGNQTKEASLNIVGDYMIDDYGNCGWEHIYDGTISKSSCYYDADWMPMRMPLNKPGSYSIFKEVYESDEYGRDTLLSFVDKQDKPDTNQFGVHKIRYRYNEHGLLAYQGYFDLNDRPVDGDGYGTAKMLFYYNDKGQPDSTVYLNTSGEYLSSRSYWCKAIWEYDKEGNNVHIVHFTPDSSDRSRLAKRYEYILEPSGNSSEFWYEDNQKYINLTDSLGRDTLNAWYTLDGLPTEYEGFHKYVSQYDDEYNAQSEYWCAADSSAYAYDNSYTSQITFTDSTCITQLRYLYDFPAACFVSEWTQDFKSISRQWDLTPYGEHARVGWFDNLYYNVKVNYNMYGNIRTLVGRNEFDEPSYISVLVDDGPVYYFASGDRNYNEFGNEIPDSTMTEFKSNLPKVFCIEITDTSVAYPLGIRNGDIILSYGSWATTLDLKSNTDGFYIECILQANSPKQMKILRHFPESGSSRIFSISLPEGKNSELGFYPHKIYYTRKEKERLLSACESQNMALSDSVPVADTTILIGVPRKGGLIDHMIYWVDGFRDPGILLFASETYMTDDTLRRRDVWSVRNHGIGKWEEDQMYLPAFSGERELYFTQDFATIYHYAKDIDGNGGLEIFPIRISSGLYDRIMVFYENNASQIPDETDYMEKMYYSMVACTDEEDGLFRESGFCGSFLLLRYNGWKYGDDYDMLVQEIESSRNTEKALVFVEIDPDTLELVKCHKAVFPAGIMGLRFFDVIMPETVREKALKYMKKNKIRRETP